MTQVSGASGSGDQGAEDSKTNTGPLLAGRGFGEGDIQNSKTLKNQDYKSLLIKYEVNREKYQSLSQKTICLSSSRLVKTQKNDNDFSLDGEAMTINNSYDINLELEVDDLKSISLKQILEEKDSTIFKKRIGLSATQNCDRIRTHPEVETPGNSNTFPVSSNQFFKRKTFTSKYRFPDKLMPKGWISSFNKNKNLEDSNNTSNSEEQISLITKRKYKDLPGLRKPIQTPQARSTPTCNYFRKIKGETQPPQDPLECSNLEKTKKLQNGTQMTLLKEQNRGLQQAVRKAKTHVKVMVNKYNESQSVKQLLTSSLKFQRSSYSTLLKHHNNQLDLLNNQIKELVADNKVLEEKYEAKNEEVRSVLEENSVLKNGIQEKDQQFLGLKAEFSQLMMKYLKKIEDNDAETLQLHSQIFQLKQEAEERQTNLDDQDDLRSNLRKAEKLISSLKWKYQELQEYVSMLNSSNTQDPSSSSQLTQTYMKQTFMKYQKSCDELTSMKTHVLQFQDQMRNCQRMVFQLKQEIEYRQCSIAEMEREHGQTQHKLVITQKMLGMANECLMSKQLQMGNHKYQAAETVRELQEENGRLREQIGRIAERVDQMESRISGREFEEDMDSDKEDGLSLFREGEVLKNQEDLSFIQVS